MAAHGGFRASRWTSPCRSEAEQRLSQVIDGAQVGTWEHDMRTGVTLVSDRWAEILGYRAVELNPMPLNRLVGDAAPRRRSWHLIEHEREAFDAGHGKSSTRSACATGWATGSGC